MRTYVIFNGKTGEIVHTHTEGEELRTSHDDVIAMVDPSHDRKVLEVAMADSISPDECYRVDVKTKKLECVDPDKVPGFGSGSGGPAAVARVPRVVKTVYEKVPRSTPSD